MKAKLALLLAVLALMSVAAFAQSGIAGKWVGELSAKDGHGVSQPITVDLKLDGATLSGTVTEGALDARPIQAATAEGTTVTFRTVRNLGGSDINVNWKGELKGEDLTLTREIGPAPAEAAGGRGGGGGGGRGGGGAAGGRGGGARGGAAPAAGAQRGAAADVPPVPNPDQPAPAADAGAARGAGGRGAAAGAAAAGGRGGGGGGGGRGAGAPAAAAAPPGPTVTLTLHRSR